MQELKMVLANTAAWFHYWLQANLVQAKFEAFREWSSWGIGIAVGVLTIISLWRKNFGRKPEEEEKS